MIAARSLRFRWVVIAAYSVLLIIVALLPARLAAHGPDFPDWISHAVAYGLQSGLIYWGLIPVFGWRGAMTGAILGTIVFGAATEVLQFLRPGRSVEFKDLAADAGGAVIVCLAIIVVSRSLSGGER